MKSQKFIPLLVVAAGLLAYHNSFTGPFVFDDTGRILDNPHIRQLWPLWEAIRGTSRPLVQLSLAVNYALGGYHVAGYHAFNLAVHILAALTFYGIVRRTLEVRYGQTARWLALGTALVWMLHPLQTQSVTYVIQRAESLMGLFYLLTLYCFIRGLQRRAWHIAAVACCALGIACKPIMVTAPLVVLLYDRVFIAKSIRQTLQERGWLYLGLAVTWPLVAGLLVIGPSEWQGSAGPGLASLSVRDYLVSQPGVILHYLRLILWPSPLCFDYAWPVARTAGAIVPPTLIIIALMAATGWACVRKPWLGFVGIWFFLILAPSSSVIPVADLAVEHRVYLSLAAVAALLVVGGHELAGRIPVFPQACALAAVVLGLGWGTVQRNCDYRSDLSIWSDTVAKRPDNARAHGNLGVALDRVGRSQEAIGQWEQALRIKPDFAEAHIDLGDALARGGRLEDALGHYQQALRIKPNSVKAHYNMGDALQRANRIPEAIAQYEQALQIKPDNAEAHNNLGIALLQAGKIQEAIKHYEQALEINPNYARAHNNLGMALGKTGNMQGAIRQYEQALRIQPDYPEGQNNLAWLLATSATAEDPVRAISLAEQACKLTDNRVAPYLDTLAAAYANAGRFDAAVAAAREAIELARIDGQTQLVSEIESRLDLYRDGHAYQKPLGATPSQNP